MTEELIIKKGVCKLIPVSQKVSVIKDAILILANWIQPPTVYQYEILMHQYTSDDPSEFDDIVAKYGTFLKKYCVYVSLNPQDYADFINRYNSLPNSTKTLNAKQWNN